MKLFRSSKDAPRSFSSRLFYCIFSTSFLLLLIGSICLFNFSMQLTAKMNQSLTIDTLQKTGENLEQLFQQVDFSIQIAFSQKDVLASAQEDFLTDLKAHDTLRSAMRVAVAGCSVISHMCLFSDEYGLLTTHSSNVEYNDAASCMEYFERHTENAQDGNSTWYFLCKSPFRFSRKDEYAMTNVRELQLLTNPGTLHLVVSISEQKLSEAYGFLGENSYIMTGHGIIVSAVDKLQIGTAASTEVLHAVSSSTSDVSFLFQERNNLVYSVFLPTIDCYLIVKAPATALAATKSTMITITIAVLLFGLTFSLIWSNYIANFMVRPLKALKSIMDKSRSGDFSVRCQSEQQDEIGYLYQSFNHLMSSLEDYIVQLNEQQNLTKEIEIRLLQSQINPHLLYNTLDSALFLMSHDRAAQSIQILEQLSQYFKLALQRGNTIITIDVAIQHIQAYLNLQSLCRMKHFTLSVTGDLTLLQASILHMLMQPIVENSVLHGFDGSFEDGSIEIDLRREHNLVLIRITDNGIGMCDQELYDLRERLESPFPGGKSFGLWNIAKRIHMFYGSEYHVHIDSEFGEFTTVTLKIPYQTDA